MKNMLWGPSVKCRRHCRSGYSGRILVFRGVLPLWEDQGAQNSQLSQVCWTLEITGVCSEGALMLHTLMAAIASFVLTFLTLGSSNQHLNRTTSGWDACGQVLTLWKCLWAGGTPGPLFRSLSRIRESRDLSRKAPFSSEQEERFPQESVQNRSR